MNRRLSWVGSESVLFIVALVLPSPAAAAVMDVRGRVSTTVQELLDGEPGSVTSDESEIGVDASAPPISAGAALQTRDFDDRVIALGQGLSELAAPDLQASEGPRELGLEVAGFSDGESVSYLVRGSAVEERGLLFAGPGNPSADAEFPFNADGTREVESRISLSGAIVVWSLEGPGRARRVESELTVDVRRVDDVDPLFRTGVSLTRVIPGQRPIDTEGPIRTQEVGVDELVTLGLDDASAAILRDVAEQGILAVFVIPRQEHTYRYSVRRDEPFTLRAELSASVRTAPNSSGAAATLGRPFSELADFIGRAMPGVDGVRMEKAINRAIEENAGSGTATIPADSDSPSDSDEPASSENRRIPSPCGVFGAEWSLAPLLMLLSTALVGRRRTSIA